MAFFLRKYFVIGITRSVRDSGGGDLQRKALGLLHAQHSFPSCNCSKLKYPSHWEGPGVGPIQGITRFARDPGGGDLQRKASMTASWLFFIPFAYLSELRTLRK